MIKDEFKAIFQLTRQQPWLIEHDAAIEHLLFNECSSEAEKNLVVGLLQRFNYIDHALQNRYLQNIVKDMVSTNGCTESNSVIAATTTLSSADSAQMMLYQIKPMFIKHGWLKPKLVNNANKAANELPIRNKIFFIDEFAGSGKTIVNRVNKLKSDLKLKGIEDYSIKIYLLAASTVACQKFHDENIDFYTPLQISRGISDYYGELVSEKIQLMKRVETELSDSYEGKPMPSLGYGETETLYAREYGNTPNNVFPIFWWAFGKNGALRKTLLVRSMGDA